MKVKFEQYTQIPNSEFIQLPSKPPYNLREEGDCITINGHSGSIGNLQNLPGGDLAIRRSEPSEGHRAVASSLYKRQPLGETDDSSFGVIHDSAGRQINWENTKHGGIPIVIFSHPNNPSENTRGNNT